MEKGFEKDESQGEVIQFDREPNRYVNSDVMNNLSQLLRERLEDFHRREPLKSGMNKEELSARIPGRVDTKLFNEIVQRLVRQGDIIQEKEVIRLSSHQVALAVDQEKTRREIETIYREADLHHDHLYRSQPCYGLCQICPGYSIDRRHRNRAA